MKNSKFLKLISLALTVALLTALAVPTLTTSAADTTPEYVTSITIDFEDGERHATFGRHDADSGVNGSGCLDVYKRGTNSLVFNEAYLKSGNTYVVMFNYFAYEMNTDLVWFNTLYGNADGSTISYTNKTVSKSSVSTEWGKYYVMITAPVDSYFGFVTDDGVYIDNLTIIDITNNNGNSVYVDGDGVLNGIANESLIIPGSSNSTVIVGNEFNAEENTTVTTFKLTSTSDDKAVRVPFSFKKDKTYKINFRYYGYGAGSSNQWDNWWRVTFAPEDGSARIAHSVSMNGVPAWKTFNSTWTATKDCNYMYFDTTRTAGIDAKIHSLSIVELSTENTATKQTYTFDTHDFSSYTVGNHKSIASFKKDDGFTQALALDCSQANKTDSAADAAEACVLLDYPLTAGKIYKLSYDYMGKGNIATTLVTGGWGVEQYKAEVIGGTATALAFNTDVWKHREAVFCAEYASTHMFIRGTEGTMLYMDNVTIEEYSYNDKVSLDFEGKNAEYNDYAGYNNYSVVADPADDTNKVLKSNAASYHAFYLPTMRLQKDHVYYVTFDYYVPQVPDGADKTPADYYAFAYDTRIPQGNNSSNTPITRKWVNPVSAETWLTFKYTIKATEEHHNGIIALFCQRETYFDNIKVVDITDVLNTDAPSLDYSSEDSFFIESSECTTVTKEADAEKGAVTKISFGLGCSTTNGRVSVPFFMEADTCYVVSVTYKSNKWVAFDWNHKNERGTNGLNETGEKWVTETRYVTGAGSDMIFFYSDAGTELSIANITFKEATKAGGINGDAVIDSTDYMLLRNRIFAAARDDSKQFEVYADQNSDGAVDILDMVFLKNSEPVA